MGHQWTYSAAILVAAVEVVEQAVLVLAGTAQVVTLDTEVVVELRVGSGLVLEDRQPVAVLLADTNVDRSPVANRLAAVTPLAAVLGTDTLGVDIVLSRGTLTLPDEVGLGVGAGQGLQFVGQDRDRNGLRLST